MDQAKEQIMDVLKVGLVPNLVSSPGIGKSALAREIAKEQKLKLIDVRLSQSDPSDMQGFPFILNKDSDNVKAGYVPMNTFPIKGDEIPDGYKGWLILMDEFNSAPLNVQAAAYKIVLDRMVGMHTLHHNVAIIAAGNLATDKAIVNRLSTAMQSRLIHFEIRVCDNSWGKWADKNGVDYRVKSFIKFKPAMLHKFDPNHSDMTFPCPRTWDFLSRIIKSWKTVDISKLAVLAGTIGEGGAREFFSYTKIFGEIPTIGQIMNDPENVRFGNEPSMHYALAGLISHHMTPSNADSLIKFVSRLEIDFQVITLRAAIIRDREIKNSTGVRDWVRKNAQELLA